MDIVTYALLKGQIGNLGKSLEGISEGMTFKGSVPTESDLPSNPQGGDLYIIQDTGTKAVWDGSQWVKFDNGGNSKIEPLDKSILVKDGKIGVLISKKTNNALKLENDGLFADSGISEDDLALKLPEAFKKALANQPDKNNGLVVDDNNNIKVNVNPDELEIVDNQIGFAFEVIQSV